MSHQTGIKSNEELRNFFAKAKEGRIRMLKVVINNVEELALDSYKEAVHDWQKDYNECIVKVLDPKVPCYLFYRLDESLSTGHAWLFITWSPDFASVKNKMLYAATKSTLKLEFGAGQIKDELFGTVKDDVSLEGYLKHIKAQSAPKPMTNREEELELLRQSENHTQINVETKHKTLTGVMFPIEQHALDYLNQFQKGSLNYLQLEIDMKAEKIVVAKHKENINANSIAHEIPNDKGRFHLYRFIHTHESENFKSVIFIYSMPGFGSSIKERMLYSSCKNEFLAHLKANFTFDIVKTLEISDANELNESYLIEELHPKQFASASKFEKPKGPTARGPRRITKQTE